MATSPRAHARLLRRAWERQLGEGELSARSTSRANVRDAIAESWRRSLDAGLDPAGVLAPLEAGESEIQDLRQEHPLASLAHVLFDQLRSIAEDTQSLLVLSDAAGLLLSVQGSASLRDRASAEIGFREGSLWSETAAGTNAVGTALAADHGVQVFASEHFNRSVHEWTCSAAPVHDLSGNVVGVVDLTGPLETVHPLSLGLAMTAAATLEQRLAETVRDRDARLRRRYGDLVRVTSDLLASKDGRLLIGEHDALRLDASNLPTEGGEVAFPDGSIAIAEPLGGGEAYLLRRRVDTSTRGAKKPTLRFAALGRDRIEIELDGKELSLSQRQSEVLVLLAEHPDGLTAEELAVALWGDFGKPASARAEVSRMRTLTGLRVDAEPYRLDVFVESDIASLRRLLRQGRVFEAASLHADLLLPRSDAPGVIEIRDELESWTRNAALTSDDLDALWTWVTNPCGAEDLPAWVRFLSQVPYEDGRRALAAAHVKRLRDL